MSTKRLAEFLESLGDNANARAYLIYSACGYSSQDILGLLNLNPIYASNLRQVSPSFRAADDFISEHGKSLRAEAMDLRWQMVRDSGLLFADKLIRRGASDPDSLKASDKRLALSALSELRKLSKPGSQVEHPDYDSAILEAGRQKQLMSKKE